VGELTTVRRAFHTLKGSSRMVGLRDYGEAAWACEQLYNARLAQSPRMDDDLAAFTRDALQHLARWTDAIAEGQAAAHRAAPIVEAADSLRLQGRRVPIAAAMADVAPAAPAAPPELPVLDLPVLPDLPELAFDLPPAPAALPAAFAELPDGIELPELDLSSELTARVPGLPLPEDLDLSFPVPAAASTPEPAFDLDLGDAPDIHIQGLDEAPVAAAVSAPELPSLADVVEIDFGDFEDLRAEPDLAPQRRPETSASPARLVSDTDLTDDLDFSEVTVPLAPTPPEDVTALLPAEPSLPDIDLPFGDGLDFDLQGLPEAVPVEPEATPAGPGPAADTDTDTDSDEQVRVIGSLRIPIPLFNIYLNEADELSRRLCTELAEWGIEHERRPVSESSVVLAHSLAGSSATVGYAELSSLARALEHVLIRAAALDHGSTGEPALYNEAADEIRRLLHQFAAGFLKPMTPDLLERLLEHEKQLAQRTTEGAEPPAETPQGLEEVLEAAADSRPMAPGLRPGR
jgi:chemosensory pili system protein ChpA (sensor histidine kinase/response regulator)